LSEIEREVSGSKGRYVSPVSAAEAELTYSILSPTHIIADHTGVPDELRGTGIGGNWWSGWWPMRGPRA
jgi:predicted GNAT family acetyltransferase